MYYLWRDKTTSFFYITDYIEKVGNGFWIDGHGLMNLNLVHIGTSKIQVIEYAQKIVDDENKKAAK